ncbi:MAG: hypoxanthine phosphoribosyltransferase [Ruminococcus sp.]|nr:hypoxanthine phosphoribosyltransferase [Ruminococcus sp.]MBO5383668.1 hypoxanthine phosphoribosyltransferase [Ruminococcus sp.]MBR6669975.1 hypoxanthine phosphoribosyltransferase [Ruminococcus sp.]
MTACSNKISQVYIPEDKIKQKVAELGKIISKDYENKDLLLVGILKGSVVFLSDLMREISIPVSIDFMTVSSYKNSSFSSGSVDILSDLSTDISGKDVLIVEDIIDSGITLSRLVPMLEKRNPASIKLCTLLDKPDRRKIDINVDYVGFEIENKFIVGYGLDYAEKFRNLNYIGIYNL